MVQEELLELLHELHDEAEYHVYYCAVVFVFLSVVLYSIRMAFIKVVIPATKKTDNEVDDFMVDMVVKWTSPAAIVLFSGWTATSIYSLGDAIDPTVKFAFLAVLAVQAVGLVESTIIFLLENYVVEDTMEGKNLLHNFRRVLQAVLYSGAVVFILDNVGFDVSSLIASMGIGGIAIALAVQNILTDAFASFCMLLDRQFEIGDLVSVHGHVGHVEHIGFKSTRLRALTGERIVFANQNLLGADVLNYKRAEVMNRTITLGFDVNTPDDRVRAIPDILTEAVNRADPRAKATQVWFKDFGTYTLDFEVRYQVKSNSNEVHREVLGKINTSINEKVKEENLVMPFKTKVVVQQISRE